MTAKPLAELDTRYSSEGAHATEWAQARARFADADVFWVVTTRPEGGPHVTPLLSVWHDGAPHFCTGPTEQKARNLAADPRCALITGCNRSEGLDVVLEGTARRLTDRATLEILADAWVAKYGEDWRFGVGEGAFTHEQGEAWVFAIVPARGYGFGKGDEFSQTRWRFGRA